MKTRFISAIAFIAAVALGCSTKDDFKQSSREFYDVVEEGYRIEILQAILPEPFIATKLLKDDDGTTTWQLTDQIAVCAYNEDTDKYKYVTGAPTLVPGQFIIKVEAPWVREAYAIYPAYWSDDRYCNSPVKVNLPEMYFCDEIESPTANVGMIAINGQSPNLTFRQFCGSLRLTVTGVPAGTEELSIVFDKCITGSFEIKNPRTNSPYISVDDTATASEIRVIFDPPTTAEGSCEINIPMPGGNYGTIAGSAFDGSQNEVASGNAVFAKTLDRTSFEFFTLDLSAVSSSPIGGVTTTPMDVETINIQDGNHNNTWN